MTGYMVKDHSAKEDRENRLPPFHGLLLLAARDLFIFLHASSHEQDSTYHVLCYTRCGALAGMRTSTLAPLRGINPTTQHTMSR